jgi:hypothetical protein
VPTVLTTAEAAARIGPLFESFDVVLTGLSRDQRAILAMTLRGIDIYRELSAIADLAPNVSLSGLRSLIDLAILVRWIEECPKLRLAMWSADDDRDRLRGAAGHANLRAGRGLVPIEAFTKAHERRLRARIERIRAIATNHDEPISSKRGNTVLPNVKARSEASGDLSEAGFMFQILSQPSHSSGRAYVHDVFVRRYDGFHYQSNATFDGAMIRDFAVPSVCLLLASAARQLDLGLAGELDRVRLAVAAWSVDDEDPLGP